ncbi:MULTISPECIES: molecular chaperone [unclassified Serratia (in: enterobacteria)]|uniref:fimbrial biogenesis chaperone n=2 Tax=Serratia TaxID=613 RepID=UPI000A88FB2A|nr:MULTISPECIES: molecular chaperone [unclassified Serratia (in: enterobacteria)]
MRKLIGLFFAGGLFLSSWAQAGVMIESSRVVFSAADRERSLLMSNDNPYPVIVQTWIDDGSPDGTPETAGDVPVLPLPGLFRLEAGEKKNLRLLATQIKQPQDRESLYWLNIYEIPPTDANLPPGVSAIKVAVRLQLKMFYRPQNLKPSIDKLPEQLQFNLSRLPGILQLKVENTSPYYATFSAAKVTGGGKSHPLEIGMLAPFSSKTLDLSGEKSWQPDTVNFVLINDDGNGVEANKSLKR